ncbi:LysR family transcriptional regulator [Sphingobium sp. BS19]|uniref:LysR family transcriptional regulator n=1 Tax=Sphingobium sp. BS19 TaxID=3018973 RepID=UPI0022EDE21D|nr:LysR family transcriptional regulator [Sphingobium sp. BS19]GLJ00389.1 LysR family transcriptional regulator [Sphingobium sp. BS19]
MIDRYHLRYFLAVVDTGNFSRAAIACNVSQPTLSVGISKLEKSLGKVLFNRTNRRVALTDAGSRLVSHARMIETGFATAEREVIGSVSLTTVRLGVLVTTPRRWIEAILAAQRAVPDGDRIEIVEGRNRDLRSRLARGRIDVALTSLHDREAGDGTQHLLTEGYSLALSAAHPLAAREIVSIEELANDPMIVRRHCELLPETSRFFTARSIRPFFPARTTSDDKALSYVRAGLGITVMPDGFQDSGVARVRLEGFDFTRDIGLVYAAHVDSDALSRRRTLSALIETLGAEHDA